MIGLGTYWAVIDGIRAHGRRAGLLALAVPLGLAAAFILTTPTSSATATPATISATSSALPRPISLRRAKARATRIAKKECRHLEDPNLSLKCQEWWADECHRMVPPLRWRNRAQCDANFFMRADDPIHQGLVYMCVGVVEMWMTPDRVIHHYPPQWDCRWFGSG